jgi:hypothetical protein
MQLLHVFYFHLTLSPVIAVTNQLYRVYKKKVIELQRAIVSELLCV